MLIFGSVSCQSGPSSSGPEPTPLEKKYQAWVDSVRYYKKHYGLKNEFSKKVNNRGNGDDALYGVRNFRAVLHGVYYRGGANNRFNKDKTARRKNSNPLPAQGLENLCKENFGEAFYFYTTNANLMQRNTICETTESKSKNNLNYSQVDALEETGQIEMLRRIHRHITDMDTRPLYGHCWNGWHASGLIGALALIQFCHYDNKKALDYWIRNTDGNSAGYGRIKKRISSFKRLPELEVDEKFRKEMCP